MAYLRSGDLAVIPAATGTVLQVVDGTAGTGSLSTTSTTYQATPTNCSITYTAGNKIFAVAHCNSYIHAGGNDAGSQASLSTNANNDDNDMVGSAAVWYIYTAGLTPGPEGRLNQPLTALFSPAGTSVTVTLKVRAENGGTVNHNPINTRIYLMEIQA